MELNVFLTPAPSIIIVRHAKQLRDVAGVMDNVILGIPLGRLLLPLAVPVELEEGGILDQLLVLLIHAPVIRLVLHVLLIIMLVGVKQPINVIVEMRLVVRLPLVKSDVLRTVPAGVSSLV